MANFFSHGNVGCLCKQQQSFPAFTAFIPSPSIKSTRLGKKNESERCKLGDLGTHPPATSHSSTSTHITHWKWSAADGADTCHHRRVRPERRWPPATGAAWRGGREDKAALPGQLRCLFVRRALTLGFTQTQPCWVSGHCSRKTRTRRGTRCPLSATNSKSLKPTESQTRANPAPISSMQVTDSPLGTDGR